MTAMGSFSIWHWMLFGAVALLLFGGKGKISDLMGDVAKGVKSFKKGLADDDEAKPAPTVQPRGRSRTASASTPTTFTRSAERAPKRSACDGGPWRWPRRSSVAGSGEPCSILTSAR